MKHKRLIAGVLIICLILLCTGIILVSWLSIGRIATGGIHIRLFNLGRISAEADQEWPFKSDGPIKLVVDSTSGDIDVSVGEGNEIKVTAHKTAWGITTKRAESALANMPIEVKQEGNQVILRYKPSLELLSIGSTQIDTVDFTVIAPEECSVIASTKFGKIAVTGTKGDTDLSSDFGNLAASETKGSLRASTNSGDIHAQRIEAGQKTVYLETDFGSIELQQTEAYTIELRTKSGKLAVKDVETNGKVELQSEFGDIQTFDSKMAALIIHTNSGKITLNSTEMKSLLVASSDFGDIDVQQVIALGYDLNTNSGNIFVQKSSGPIKASTEFGKIVISGAINADLDLQTNSGTIEFSGTLGDGPHRIEAEFGDIQLKLPENTQLTLNLKTEFGKLKSSFPITLSGEVEVNSWQGAINGGGAVLQAQTNNGDIILDVLSE